MLKFYTKLVIYIKPLDIMLGLHSPRAPFNNFIYDFPYHFSGSKRCPWRDRAMLDTGYGLTIFKITFFLYKNVEVEEPVNSYDTRTAVDTSPRNPHEHRDTGSLLAP